MVNGDTIMKVNGQLVGTVIGILAGAILFSMAATRWANVDLDRAGMGRNTVPRTAVLDGLRMSAVGQPEEIFPLWRQFRQAGYVTGLWLGASQIYCINDIQPQDRLAVEYVNQWAIEREVPLRMTQLTAPNANLHELLAFYLACRNAGFKPAWLVVGLTYDDLREETLRENFLEAVGDLDAETLRVGGEGVAQLQARMQRVEKDEPSSEPVARNPTTGTPQERLETVLVGRLEAHYPGYSARDKLAGQFKITLRASLARMLGQVSKRRVAPIPKAQRTWNHRALESMVNLAREDGTRVLIYKPPHRQADGPFYHDRERYDAYFDQVAAWCAAMEGVDYLDLEKLVPPEFWGVTNWGRPDVFHFTVEGHRRLAGAIQAFFQRQMAEDPSALQ